VWRRLSTRIRPGGALLLALSCWGCGEETLLQERTLFLTNLPAEQISVGEVRPFDLHGALTEKIELGSAAAGFDRRRVLVQRPGTEVSFHDLPLGGATLETAVFYRDELDSGLSYEMQILHEDSSDQRRVIWEGELRAPGSEEERAWVEIRVPLLSEEGEEGTLHFRTSGVQEEERSLHQLPGWANPRLVIPEVPLEEGTPSRNIIVFLVDTLRPDHLGAYGYGRSTSPHLDALAEESLLFTSAHAGAPWTKASVATIFTALPPTLHGAEDFQDRLPDSITTLAEALRSAGYRTGAAGANGWIFNRKFNMLQGFEEAYDVLDHKREGGARADSIVAEAIDWIERNKDGPFFLYLHLIDPHEPYVPSEALRASFSRRPYTGSLTGRLEGPGAHQSRQAADVDQADLDFLVDLYDAEVRFADDRLGELVAYLRSVGLWEETAFVFTADHGEELLDHGSWSHGGTLYQEQLVVPLLIKPPASMGIPAGRIDEAIGLAHLPTTLTSFAGLPAEGLPFHGQNLVSLVMAPQLWKPQIVLSELNKEHIHSVALRDGDRKYIRSFAPAEQELLFDLASDPEESRNLVDSVGEKELSRYRSLIDIHLKQAARDGIVVEFLGDGLEVGVIVRVLLEGNGSGSSGLDYSLVDSEREGDRFLERPEGDHIFEFELGGKDQRDGLRLHLAPQERARVQFFVVGDEGDPEHILLGPSETPAATGQLVLSPTDEHLWTEEPPAWSARPGFWCRIWNLRPGEVLLDGEELAELQALGYMGE